MNNQCDAIIRFIELVLEKQAAGVTEPSKLAQCIRHEFAGERIYIQKRAESIREVVEHCFTGNNTDKIARDLHVSRRTVYRALAKRRVTAR